MARRASKNTPHEIAYYEGLIFKTASMYVGLVEEDFDDVRQALRIKVWRALVSFDATRSSLPVERYVFTCVKNGCKDLVKRKRRNELYIEDLAPMKGAKRASVEKDSDRRDAFEHRYLSVDSDELLTDAEDSVPLIPSTLSELERSIIALLYLDYSQKETAVMLSIGRSEMERAVRSLRMKMGDWRPVTVEVPTAVAA